MQVVGEINNISEELYKSIPKLEPKQVVTFQMLTGQPNNYPKSIPQVPIGRDSNGYEMDINPFLYPVYQIPTKDRIYDPYKKGSNKWVDIAVIESFEQIGNSVKVTPRLFAPGKGEPQFRYNGRFSLVGGVAADEELYEFLMLTNANRDTKNRDEKIDVLFYLMDVAKESAAKRSRTDDLRKALNIAGGISIEKANEIANSLNWGKFPKDDILMQNIEDYAQKFPAKFVELYNDPATKEKSLVKQAFDLQILTFDVSTRDVNMDSQHLFKVKKSESDHITATNNWLQSARNGDKILASIQKQVERKLETV